MFESFSHNSRRKWSCHLEAAPSHESVRASFQTQCQSWNCASVPDSVTTAFDNVVCLKRIYDDVIKHFPRYWPFVRGIDRLPMNSPPKGQWRRALMFSLIYTLNKRLSKQSRGWRYETPSRSLWHHCTVIVTNWSKIIATNNFFNENDELPNYCGKYPGMNISVCFVRRDHVDEGICVSGNCHWPLT